MSSENEPKDVDIPDNFDIEYIEMSDGVKLRVLRYQPENPKGFVYMYPGMNTLVLSWIKVLEGLSKEGYAIDYVESREKHTAKYPNKILLTKERMIQDCVEAENILELKERDYIAIGSSLGSTTLIHCMAKGEIKPKHAVLVGPTPHFKVPFAIRLLIPLVTKWTYDHIALPVMKKIIMRKFTNEDADPKQKRKYSLALDLAEPMRLKKALKVWRGNKIWEILPDINGQKTTCYLIGASEDKLHPDEDTRNISERIKGSEFVDLRTNTAAHDQPLIDMILDFD